MIKKPGQGQDFPDTEPLSLVPPGEELSLADSHHIPSPAPAAKPAAPVIPDTLGLELAPVGGGEQDLESESRKEGRVCPQPTRWLEFYRVLQDAAGGAALPQPPLTGSAWMANPPAMKRKAFDQQIAWAVQNGHAKAAASFLNSLGKSDWYYGN